MVINVGRGVDDRRLIDALYSTIHSVFPTLYVSDLSDSFNTILFATKNETSLNNFLENYIQLYNDPETPPFILDVMSTTYDGLKETKGLDIVYTDDLAPVESITNSMVMRFLFAGDVETLQ